MKEITHKEKQSIVNAMTVDVEDYFQVSAFGSHINKQDWPHIPCRVEANMERILKLFDEHGVKATFFTLGWIAERYPEMIRSLVAQGHELASHGWEHIRATEQTPGEFKSDVMRTKSLLEDISGEEVKGYRAASYSICEYNFWALEVLADTGHQYSSSIVPISHDLYGIPDGPRFSFLAADDRLLEIPVSTIRLIGRNISCGGGGWFRLFPYGFSRWALRRINQVEAQSAIFYFHPWEIDPDQPRVPGIKVKTRFRHYLNLKQMDKRLHKLLSDFSWGRVDEVFLETQ